MKPRHNIYGQLALAGTLILSTATASIAQNAQNTSSEDNASSSEVTEEVEEVSEDINTNVENANNSIESLIEDVQTQVDGLTNDLNEEISPYQSQFEALRETYNSTRDRLNQSFAQLDDLWGNVTSSFEDLWSGISPGGSSSGSGGSVPGYAGEIPLFFRQMNGYNNPDPQSTAAGQRDNLTAQVENTTGAVNLPNLKQLKRQIMTDRQGSSGQKLANSMELGGEISYLNRDEYNQQAERKATRGVAYESAISTQAQAQMKKREEKSQQNTQKAAAIVKDSVQSAQENQNMAEESNNLDVTQQIMQNLSTQTALQSDQLAMVADQNGRIAQSLQAQLEEQYQGRVDRAYGNMLNAQIAKEVSGANTARRRLNTAAGNVASQRTGAIMLPGNRAAIEPNN